MIISPNSPIYIMIYKDTLHFFFSELTIDQVKLWIKAKMIFVLTVTALRRSFRNTTHSVMLIFNPHHNSLYFLDPWGKESDVGKNLNIHVLRSAFKTAFGVHVNKYYPTTAMCPMYRIQREGDRKKIVMCALWTMLLITKYLAYVKENGVEHDPTKMVQTYFDHRDEAKHPLNVIDRWFRDLYPSSNSRSNSRSGERSSSKQDSCNTKEVVNCKCVTKCKPGYQRNRTTLRCHKNQKHTVEDRKAQPTPHHPITPLMECPDSVYRKCRYEKVDGVCRRACEEGKERHPVTHRCRRVWVGV